MSYEAIMKHQNTRGYICVRNLRFSENGQLFNWCTNFLCKLTTQCGECSGNEGSVININLKIAETCLKNPKRSMGKECLRH